MKVCRLLLVLTVAAFMVACSQPDKAQEKLLLSDGSSISLAQLQGKWVFVNYWATWCHYCKKDIAVLDRFAKAHPGKVVVLGYNYDDMHDAELNKAMKTFGVKYAELEYMPADLLNIPEDVNALPVTFVMNPKGQFVKTLDGLQTLASLNRAMVR